MKRHLMLGMLAPLLLLAPSSVLGQEDPAIALSELLDGSSLVPAFEELAAYPADPGLRADIRRIIDVDRTLMLMIDPDACVLPAYLTYWEILTLTEVALDLSESFDPDAAGVLYERVGERFFDLSDQELLRCVGY